MNVTLDTILTCIAQYKEAVRNEDAAREAYEGHSWYFHGQEYARATQEARVAAQKAVDDYISFLEITSTAGATK